MIKIISAHQPAYLPWLGYFHKIAISDYFVMLDMVQFEKNSFINRNRIKTVNGPAWMTIPVLITGHTSSTIKETKINNSTNWKKKHWMSLYLNYKKAPYFSKFSDFFEELYKKEWLNLLDFINYALNFLLKELDIKTDIHKQSDSNITSKKQDLIIDLARYFKAQIFVFGMLGRDYVDVNLFERNSVMPYFQEYICTEYRQLGGEFIPNLSVIDLLFNMGSARALEIIMQDNITKDELKKINGVRNEKDINYCGSSR